MLEMQWIICFCALATPEVQTTTKKQTCGKETSEEQTRLNLPCSRHSCSHPTDSCLLLQHFISSRIILDCLKVVLVSMRTNTHIPGTK